MRAVSLAVLATLALIGTPHVAAEDEAPVKTAAQRFAEKVQSLPAPGEKHSFDATGRIAMGSMDLGTFRMSAEAAESDGKTVWKCRDIAEIAVGEKTLKYETVAYHDARLVCLSGNEKRDDSGAVSEADWKKGEGGFALTKKSGDATETVTLTRQGGICSVAALILFCRNALGSEQSYECAIFDAHPDEGSEYFVKGTITVEKPGKWRERDALLVTVKKGTQTISLAFAKESHDLLGMDVIDGSGTRFTLVVGSKADPARATEADFVPPADTPRRAALIAALAFGTRDTKLLDQIVHWKTLHENLMRSNPTSKATVEQLRASVLSKIAKGESKVDRKKVIFGIRAVSGAVKVTMDGTDRAKVKFPKAFKNLEFGVGQVDGHWYVIRFPGT